MKILNKLTIFIISISQVVFASTKINPNFSEQVKVPTESKKTLAQELHEKKLIKTEKSSDSANCVGNLTD